MTNIEEIKETVTARFKELEALPEDQKIAEYSKYFMAFGVIGALEDYIREMDTTVLMQEAKNSNIAEKFLLGLAKFKNIGVELGYVKEIKKDAQ